MSQWTTVAVRCDRREAAAPDGQCVTQEAARPGESLAQLRARLITEGWGREAATNGRDWCPLHRPDPNCEARCALTLIGGGA